MNVFTIRPYVAGDEVGINDGFNRVFGLNRSLDEWRWKFRPEDDASRVMVAATDDNRIVAHYGAVRERLRFDGYSLWGGHTVDVYCLREPGTVQHRVYQKTAAAFYRRFGSTDDLPLLFGFPSVRAMRIGRLRLDYAEPFPLLQLERSVPGSLPRRLGLFKPRASGTPFDDAAADRLWNRVEHRYPTAIVRDGARLRRRYFSRPNHAYRFLAVSDGGEWKAWAVAVTLGRVLHWIDLLWDGDPETLGALEADLLDLAQGCNARKIEIRLTEDPAADRLRTAGWQTPTKPDWLAFSARSLAPAIDAEAFAKRCYVTFGDTDHV